MSQRMNSIHRGKDSELIIAGNLTHTDLFAIETDLEAGGVVLSAFYRSDGGIVPGLRAAAGEARRVDDPDWQAAIDLLYTNVKNIEKRTQEDDFGPFHLERADTALRLPPSSESKGQPEEIKMLSRLALGYVVEPSAYWTEEAARQRSITEVLNAFTDNPSRYRKEATDDQDAMSILSLVHKEPHVTSSILSLVLLFEGHEPDHEPRTEKTPLGELPSYEVPREDVERLVVVSGAQRSI